MRYMLDTNLCICAIKHRPENILKNMRANLRQGLSISSITLAELEYGVETSAYPEKNAVALVQFVSILDVLAFDDRAAAEYGRISAQLRKKGTPIGTMEMLIAAHARADELVLATNNPRKFERVENLKLENWA